MADLDEMNDLEKKRLIMERELEITRMKTNIQENEFKIFSMEMDKQRLQDSIKISNEQIAEKEKTLTEMRQEFGV